MPANIENEQTLIIEAKYIGLCLKCLGDNIVTLGYNHKNNALKFRILEALTNSKEPMTTRDIEYQTGIHYTKISSAMSHYQEIVKRNGKVIKLPYIQRLAKKGPNGLYRYKITKKGKEAYIAYLQRIRYGFDLNRVRKVPKRTENYGKYPHHPIRKAEDFDLLPEQLLPYFTINKNGKQLGLDRLEHVLYILSLTLI